MKLISKEICPFVHRVRIVMQEKQDMPPVDIEHIDTTHKPDWFLKISPLGKVPTLLVEDAVLFESLVIMNYLESQYLPSLLTADKVKNGLLQSWMSYCDTLMGKFGAVRKAPTKDEFQSALTKFQAAFTSLLTHIHDKGDYFVGDTFTLLDAAYAPLFVWCVKFTEFFGVDVLPKNDRLMAWVNVLLNRSSVQETMVEDFEHFLRLYMISTNPSIAQIKC